MTDLSKVTENPPEVDSEDLTEEELSRAVVTVSQEELAQHLKQLTHSYMGSSWSSHVRRTRAGHQYLRSTLRTDRGPDMTFIFQTDWLVG